MPLIVDLLDSRELLETCLDDTTGQPGAGLTAGALEEADLSFPHPGTKETAAEKTEPAGKEILESLSLSLLVETEIHSTGIILMTDGYIAISLQKS